MVLFSFRRQQDILTHPLTPFFSRNLVETHFCLVGVVSVCFSNIYSQVWARTCVSLLLQDADCIFLNKEELEVKVDLLRRQLELLKCVFEEVSSSGTSLDFGDPVSSFRCSKFLLLETPLGCVSYKALNN